MSELHTIRDHIRWGTSLFSQARLFYGHGTVNALDEAAYLVLHALHLPPDFPDSYLDTRLTDTERQAVVSLLKKRVETRQPAPYLTNEAWFMGMPFYVDERVLIPRSPIAELIEQGFEPWTDPDGVARILDLCTGSGCIAIACAAAFPDAEVDASELSQEALAVAEINVERHQMEEQIRLVQGDLFANLERERYDIIVSNPPYVDAEDMEGLPNEYLHEPELALAAGFDGLDIVRRMLAEGSEHLNPGGIMVVEVGNSQPALELAYPEVEFTWLEFERGGHGVFLLTAEQLEEHQALFQSRL
ncbi:MAG: 50S ribosomal protein L3 N(5)-glutamine methyltransferase [Gammaproteobacteria bacterium]|nr:50S ribosomal protein L3 N(5)-glutamine methyltransferase [Gammaproteobacteria bacterium]